MLLGIHAFKLFLWKFAISIFKFSVEVRLCFHLIQIINRSTQKHFRYYFYPRIASRINVKVEWGSTSAIMTTYINLSLHYCLHSYTINFQIFSKDFKQPHSPFSQFHYIPPPRTMRNQNPIAHCQFKDAGALPDESKER